MMLRIARHGVLLLGILVCPDLFARDLESATEKARSLTRLVQTGAAIPAISVAAGDSRGIVWSEAFGQADLELGVPATPATRFRAASVSKVMTAALLMRLAAKGVVDLDTPIQSYVPDYPPSDPPITLRLLSGHLGGIRHYPSADQGIDFKHYESLGAALEIFQGDELVAPPGQRYRYTTFGYTLLGAALENAAGKPFLQAIDEELFTPLAMDASTGDVAQRIIPGRTRFYERRGGELQNADFVDPSYKWSGGGMLTTPADLVRLALGHLDSQFLPAAMRELMFTSQKSASGEETGVGIGWRIGEDWAGRRIIHHSGSMSGTRSSVILYPEQGFAISLMTNLSSTPAMVEDTLQVLAEPFLRTKTERPSLAEGSYRFEGQFSEIPLDGTIEISADATGSMSIAPALRAKFAEWSIMVGESFPIPAIYRHGDRHVLSVSTPLGILAVPIELRADGFAGETRVIGQPFRIEAARGVSP